jgi:hypothetical protein
MKTSNSSKRNEQFFIVKQILFALHVLVICAAIPVLSYMQVSHENKKAESEPRSSVEVKMSKYNNAASVAIQ